jgi:hypothetical protein
MSNSHETLANALEGLLELTCLMVDAYGQNPDDWQRQFARVVGTRLQLSLSPNTIDDEEDSDAESLVPSGL